MSDKTDQNGRVDRESALSLQRYVSRYPDLPQGSVAFDDDGMIFLFYNLPAGTVTVTFLHRNRVSIFRSFENGARYSEEHVDNFAPSEIFDVT